MMSRTAGFGTMALVALVGAAAPASAQSTEQEALRSAVEAQIPLVYAAAEGLEANDRACHAGLDGGLPSERADAVRRLHDLNESYAELAAATLAATLRLHHLVQDPELSANAQAMRELETLRQQLRRSALEAQEASALLGSIERTLSGKITMK